jgi:hypothetical protein
MATRTMRGNVSLFYVTVLGCARRPCGPRYAAPALRSLWRTTGWGCGTTAKKEAHEEESKRGQDRHGVTGPKGNRIFKQGNCKVDADQTATEIMSCCPISLWKYPGGGHRGRLASPLVTRHAVRSMFPDARAMSPKEVVPEYA